MNNEVPHEIDAPHEIVESYTKSTFDLFLRRHGTETKTTGFDGSLGVRTPAQALPQRHLSLASEGDELGCEP